MIKSFVWKQILVYSTSILNGVSCPFSLTCRHSFEGAEGNLQKLLGKNMQWLEEHCNSEDHEVEDSIPTHHAEHIHRLIARFLLLIDIWFFDKTSLIESHQVRLLRNCSLKPLSDFGVYKVTYSMYSTNLHLNYVLLSSSSSSLLLICTLSPFHRHW
jgi:hypothetical protein